MQDILKRRRMWSQKEVIAVARYLGFDKFTKQKLLYWRDQKAFPNPAIRTSHLIMYRSNDVVNGFLSIAKRLKRPLELDELEVINAMELVAEKVRDENAAKLRFYLENYGKVSEGSKSSR